MKIVKRQMPFSALQESTVSGGQREEICSRMHVAVCCSHGPWMLSEWLRGYKRDFHHS